MNIKQLNTRKNVYNLKNVKLKQKNVKICVFLNTQKVGLGVGGNTWVARCVVIRMMVFSSVWENFQVPRSRLDQFRCRSVVRIGLQFFVFTNAVFHSACLSASCSPYIRASRFTTLSLNLTPSCSSVYARHTVNSRGLVIDRRTPFAAL